MHGPSPPLPPSAWPPRAGGGPSPARCSLFWFCIALLSLCFQVMTAAPVPFATNPTAPAPATSLPAAAFAAARASPPPWVQRMQADDTSPNKRSVAMWGGNHSVKYLITKNQWTLIVTDNGTVMGVHSGQKKPAFGVLEFLTLSVITMTTHMPHLLLTPKPNKANKPGQYGRVAIRGKKAGRFVCMNSSGRVYSSPTFSDECEFQEEPLGNTHYAYYSLKYMGHRKQPMRKWYLGINKRGKMRLGYRTKHGREFAQFMTMPVNRPPHFRPPNFDIVSSPRPPVAVPHRTTTAPPAATTTHKIRRNNNKKNRKRKCSPGPFSRCRRKKRKKKKGKGGRMRNAWGRRRKQRRRSDRPHVPLLS